jgi:hypothetical protein
MMVQNQAVRNLEAVQASGEGSLAQEFWVRISFDFSEALPAASASRKRCGWIPEKFSLGKL